MIVQKYKGMGTESTPTPIPEKLKNTLIISVFFTNLLFTKPSVISTKIVLNW